MFFQHRLAGFIRQGFNAHIAIEHAFNVAVVENTAIFPRQPEPRTADHHRAGNRAFFQDCSLGLRKGDCGRRVLNLNLKGS